MFGLPKSIGAVYMINLILLIGGFLYGILRAKRRGEL
jgi:hypothetical protein